MTEVICLSVDIINPDKPATSLAFLAGVCEHVGMDYDVISCNEQIILHTKDHGSGNSDYNKIYNAIKLDDVDTMMALSETVIQKITDVIASKSPKYLLVSLFSYMQFLFAKELLIRIRQAGTTATIVAGGPGIHSADGHGVTNGKKLLDEELIDYYVLGEGDEILPKFLQGHRDMLGLNSREYVHETWVPQIDKLDELYIRPSYKKINTDVYQNLENKTKPVLSVSTSRGCVRSCSFCDIGKSWPKFRFRSGKSVAEEIVAAYCDTGSVNFTLVDSLINGSLKSFKEFNSEMISMKKQHPGLSDFSYNGMFIVRDKRSHPEELFRLMKQAGCDSLAIGVETGSDKLRWEMNKKFTNADLDHHFEMCSKYGIRNALLMFVGYPTETDDDFEKTLQMLEKYQRYLIDDTIIGINFSGVFSMLVDTPVFDDRADLGIHISDDDLTKGLNKIKWVNHNNPDLTVQKRIQRDLLFRKRAAELRYPIPYSRRYLEYLAHVDAEFLPVSD